MFVYVKGKLLDGCVEACFVDGLEFGVWWVCGLCRCRCGDVCRSEFVSGRGSSMATQLLLSRNRRRVFSNKPFDNIVDRVCPFCESVFCSLELIELVC
jgi:hypothetical protein